MSIDNFTKDMLSMLPSWMAMRRDPGSIGAKFMDVPGTETHKVYDEMIEYLSDLFVQTANTEQIDIIYKVSIVPSALDFKNLSVIGFIDGQGFPLVESKYVSEFYNTQEEHICLIDIDKRVCYFKQSYDYIIINGTHYQDIILHHVWNCYDEFGLLLGCPRIFGETNIQYKMRIEDVFKRKGSASKDGLVNAISRELWIPPEQVDVNALGDYAFKNTLLNSDGSPSEKLIQYANKVNEVMAMTWGSATWDKGYWSSIDQDNIGIDYLPHIWDAPTAGWKDTNFQSGIGDEDDLLVEAPRREQDTQDFKYHVGLAGVELQEKDVYPTHEFKYKVVAKGTVLSESIVPEEYYYTIIASQKIPLIFKIKGEADMDQRPVHKFDDAEVYNNSQYNSLSEPDKIGSYLVSDKTKLEIVNGHSIPNPPQRYVEVEVKLKGSSDGTRTPIVHDVTLTWTDGNSVDKSIKIDTQTGVVRNGNDYIVGFTANTWNAPSPEIRVENDNFNLEFTEEGSMNLGKGEFSKVVDTEGDWNRSTNKTNIVVTQSGEIKLSI